MSKALGSIKQNASPGEQSEAPRPRWKPGQEQNPGPENQDSQHMLEQPRGSFPFQAPKTLRFKGKMADFEAKNTVNRGKNVKRTNGTQFTRVRGGSVPEYCAIL